MGEPRGRPDIRDTRRWKKTRAHVLATRAPICGVAECICPTGRAIDLSLPGTHRWGPSVDHVIELDAGHDPYDEANLVPAHSACNGRKGQRYGLKKKREAIRLRAQARELNPSRVW
jgi:5-methylcytosine-specific restriction endonuclease McrA